MTANLKIISFGYHFGKPSNCYAVYNTRKMIGPNKNNRSGNGLHKKVREDILSENSNVLFINTIYQHILHNVINNFDKFQNNNSDINYIIAIGCDFGKHRSVVTVEEIIKMLQKENYNIRIEVEHRDIFRNKSNSQSKNRKSEKLHSNRNDI